ncbi:15400_t:CDS:2 [Funneliformis geosporum]|uniref:15400_t:CDS:1 n=1 Tax=Funneliformis geosporum TaxID=1117311 RepID=A0A9W4WJS6_9GLOM|nr:15400_t:CDS:2 [Funneliformis geosporum]
MIKHLHYDYMLTSVESWCENLIHSPGNNNVSMIIKTLLRLFVDKSVKLKSLFIWPNNVYWRHYSLNRYMELIEPEFNVLLKNLKNLHVETHSHYPSAKFFQKLSLIVRNVEKIHLRTPLLGLMGFPNDMEAGIAKNLCTLIQSQTKLEEFKLMSSIKFTSLFISSLSVHTDHLKSITLFETKIDEVNSWKILTNCLNLERFEIINCVGLHSDLISPFYNINNCLGY